MEPEFEVGYSKVRDTESGFGREVLGGEVKGIIQIGFGDGAGAEFGIEEGWLHEGGLAGDAVEE